MIASCPACSRRFFIEVSQHASLHDRNDPHGQPQRRRDVMGDFGF